MNPLRTVVYYMDGDTPKAVIFEGDANLTVTPALNKCQELRNAGFRHVASSTENSQSVGKPGVDTVGPDYNWKKRR